MFSIYKLTNFTVTLLTGFCCPISGATCQNQFGFSKQILSFVYVCLLPSEVSLQLKILPKNMYKNKCREDEIDTISIAHAVYFECFNTVQIAHACLRRML